MTMSMSPAWIRASDLWLRINPLGPFKATIIAPDLKVFWASPSVLPRKPAGGRGQRKHWVWLHTPVMRQVDSLWRFCRWHSRGNLMLEGSPDFLVGGIVAEKDKRAF